MPDSLKNSELRTCGGSRISRGAWSMAGYFNTDIVKEGTAFNRAEIEGAMKHQGIPIRSKKGDVVLFYTGWQKLLGKDNKRFISAQPWDWAVMASRSISASLDVAMASASRHSSNFEMISIRKDAGSY